MHHLTIVTHVVKRNGPGTHCIIWQRYVDKLVQPSRSEDGWVNDVRTVGSPDDEHVLLIAHAVHLCQDLVDHTVRCSTWEGGEEGEEGGGGGRGRGRGRGGGWEEEEGGKGGGGGGRRRRRREGNGRKEMEIVRERSGEGRKRWGGGGRVTVSH